MNKENLSCCLWIKGIQENRDYLGEVDGLIGDGDHGMNMNKGFTVFAERYKETALSFTEGLEALGMVLLNEIGGSMGPIYGTIFLSMAEEGNGLEEIALPDFTRMLGHGLEELFQVIDARQGDKTLVDTLFPAVERLKQSVEEKDSFRSALEKMKEEAERGKNSTKELVARYGRSSRLGERSRGVLDAGAVSCCILLKAMADGIEALL